MGSLLTLTILVLTTLATSDLMGAARAEAPAGTLVEVQDLFFNLPARQKFLSYTKAGGEELRAASRRIAPAVAAGRQPSELRWLRAVPPAAREP